MTVGPVRLLAAAICVWATSAAPARADLVYFNSGRTMSVKSHRTEGELVVLTLRNGGEIHCASSVISRIEPDEVPYPEPEQAADASATTPRPSVLEAVPFGDIIDAVSAQEGVDSTLVRALIHVESGFRARARSPKGAMGLMQLMPATARQYAVKNPYDPKANITAGIKHLKSLLSRFEVSLALAAYNAGETAVQKFGGIPPYRETRNYVQRILRLAGLPQGN
jgi:soluble lytic murein transglycosylase-like protein